MTRHFVLPAAIELPHCSAEPPDRTRVLSDTMASAPSEPESNQTSCNLMFVDDSAPGITRRRFGRGWAYYDAEGERIKDRARITQLNAIALPPAYVDAWFCPAADGHILATGIDAKGRKQYRYHPDFRTERDGVKFDRVFDFGKALPLVRARVAEDLATKGLGRERAVASVVRLLDLGTIRVGNESYAKSNRSFGATTLRTRHAKLSARMLKLRFKAKAGKMREVTLTDRRLLAVVREMQDLPGQHLFQYLDGDGVAHAVTSGDVNAYLREGMGGTFSAKDFRTFHGSVLAFQTLAQAKGRVPLKMLLEQVSERLGNTPAIARKSYIHPAVIELVDHQLEWRAALRLPRKTRWASREERGLLALLENSPSAADLLAA